LFETTHKKDMTVSDNLQLHRTHKKKTPTKKQEKKEETDPNINGKVSKKEKNGNEILYTQQIKQNKKKQKKKKTEKSS